MPGIQDLIKKAQPKAPSKFIVMGDPMTGKTTLAAKSPKPLFLSTDGNAAKAGLDAIDVDSLDTLRQAVNYFPESEYETLVIDTIEGIADLFEKDIIAAWNSANPQLPVSALSDVPYGKLTGQLNKRIASFSETLWSLPKNVVVLTYTKRQTDELTGSIVLNSELKSIRHFTKFSDGLILTSYDGEHYKANVVSKRTVMAGEVNYGTIEPFLIAAGWKLPAKKTKIGTAKKG